MSRMRDEIESTSDEAIMRRAREMGEKRVLAPARDANGNVRRAAPGGAAILTLHTINKAEIKRLSKSKKKAGKK